MKILVVEDNAVTLKILELLLAKWGYEAIAVDNGPAALRLIQAPDGPRLILLDWMLPGMDGLELCRQIRSATTGAETSHIILLTARSETQDVVAGLQAGANDYVVKPFHADELRVRINAGRRILALQAALDRRARTQAVLEMAGAVCHEMNQPLQTITGYLDLIMLDNNPDTSPQLQECLRVIRGQINRMGAITRKLMRITTYETREYLAGTKIIDLEKSSADAGKGD